VCLTTVGVLTDVCDAVGDELAPYGDEVVGMLIHNLGSNDVHRSIKPQARATPACPRTRLRLGPGPSIRPAACGSRGGAAGLLAASAEEAVSVPSPVITRQFPPVALLSMRLSPRSCRRLVIWR
jgi:hypothetical protein